MVKRAFSSGLPKLDAFVGGFLPGDTFLTFFSEYKHWAFIVEQSIRTAVQQEFPIVYLSCTDYFTSGLGGYRKLHHLQLGDTKASPKTLLRSVRKTIQSQRRNSVIIIDELSTWKHLLGPDRHTLELFESVASLARDRSCLLLASVRRNAQKRDFLARCKDSASVVIDIISHDGDGYCQLISSQGRYAFNGIIPLRLKHSLVRRQSSGAADEPAGETEKLRNRYLQSVQEAEQSYSNLFERTSQPMAILNYNGDVRHFNSAAIELLGATQEELRLAPLTSFFPDREKVRFLRMAAELQKRRKSIGTFPLVRKNKPEISLDIRCSDLGNDFILVILQDVSQRMLAKDGSLRSQKTYESLLEGTASAIVVLDRSRPRFTNARFLAVTGYTDREQLHSIVFKDLLVPASHKAFMAAVRDIEREPSVLTRELQIVRKDRSTVDCTASISFISFEGKNCIQVSLIDTSEQRRVVAALQMSFEKYQAIVDRSVHPTAIFSAGRVEFANKAFAGLFGFDSAEETGGKEIASFVGEADHEPVIQFLSNRSRKQQGAAALSCSGIRKNTSPFEMEVVAVSLAGDDHHLMFFRDVTAEKKVQRELDRHLDELGALERIFQSLSSSADLDTIIHRGTHAVMDILGWEMAGCYLLDERKKELHLAFQKGLTEAFLSKLGSLPIDEGFGGFLSKTQESLLFTAKKYPSYLPHRSAFEAMSVKSIFLIPLVSGDKFIGCLILCSKGDRAQQHSDGLMKAITAQAGSLIGSAVAAQRIREIQQRYESLFDSVGEIMYAALPNGAMQFISRPVELLTGYVPREFYRTPALWLNLVHPDDKRLLLERITQLDSHNGRFETEYRIIPKGKATPRWVRDTVMCVRDEQGTVISLRGSITDISETREIIRELRANNELHANLLSSFPEGVMVCDRGLKCLQWNQSMVRMTGIQAAEVVGKPLSAFFTAMESEDIRKLAHRVLDGNVVTTEDHRYVHPETGTESYISMKYTPLHNAEGEPAGIVGVATNISDRRKFENERRESEQVLRNVIDTMGDVLLITDLKGGVMEVNQTFLRSLGYSRAEITGVEFPYPWLLDEEMGRFVLWIAELRDKNWLHDFDMTWKAKDGHLIPMSLSTTLLRNSMGEPVAMLNIARDITERTRLAKDLANRNTQIEMINRVVSKANQTMDFDEIFHAIAEEIEAVVPCDSIHLGLLSEDGAALSVFALKGSQALQRGDSVPLDQTVSQFAFEAKRAIIINNLAGDPKYRSLRSHHIGLKSQISIPIILKDQPFGALNIASQDPDRYNDEHLQLLQPLAQQIGTIVDRVQLFQQVTDDSTYIHNLLDSIDSIVYTVDTQYRIREVNQAWHAFMQESGFPGIRNYQGTNLFEVLPNDSLKGMLRKVVDHLIDGSIRIFSEEFVSPSRDGDRIYQITINPMVIERRIKGLVFTHTDITTLKKAEAELKKSYDQLLVLNEISTLINTSLDLDEILQAAIPLLKKDVRADAILVYLIDQKESDIVLAKQIGFEGIDSSTLSRLKGTSSVTGSVIHSKEPLYISENVSLDERILPQNREILKKANLESAAVIPLASKDRVLGALDVFYSDVHEFSNQDRQIFSLLGNQLGTAVENAQLYGELRSQIGRLTVLYELSQQLTSTLDIDQIFQAIQESVQRVVSYETFNIDLYDSTLRSLKSVYHVSTFGEEKHVQYDSGVLRRISVKSPEELVLSTKRSYYDRERSSMCVPMLSKETIIGMMSVSGSGPDQYTDTHLRILESIGNLVAIALEKAKLYEETVKISLEIQRRNKELDDFTYVVSHDLKEPLISIEGYSRILQLDYSQSIQGEGKEYLDSIVGATTRMKGLIDDLLMLSRVSRPEISKPVSIQNIIGDIQTDMDFKVRQKGVTFVVPADIPVINGNETQLKVVFRNLIGNAVKFNNKPNPIVEIGFHNAENNSYLFFVKDNGIGIPKEFYEKIFVIFQRLHRREEYEGSGAGLAIVKKIIEMHKGKIWVESEIDKGTTFFFTIPKPE